MSQENGNSNASLCAFSKSLNIAPSFLACLVWTCIVHKLICSFFNYQLLWKSHNCFFPPCELIFLYSKTRDIKGCWPNQPYEVCTGRNTSTHSQAFQVQCDHFRSRWPPTAADQFSGCFSNLVILLICFTQSKQHSYCCRAKALINIAMKISNGGVLGFQVDLN